MKNIAVIGAGISGLFIANLFKRNPDYNITVYEKNSSITLEKGYGIQLSVNSIKLLNKKKSIFGTSSRSSDYAQALMELGALICKPINPLCNQCPISNKCKSLHKKDFDLTKIAKKY